LVATPAPNAVLEKAKSKISSKAPLLFNTRFPPMNFV
jgi:hypothetical protein